jgi:hypothetical protein
MTSLLAFAWPKTHKADTDSIYDHDTPGVSASSSGDTLTNQSSQDSMFDVPAAPATPEGFRQRKSADSIRRDLNLPPPQSSFGWKGNTTCIESSSQCGGTIPVFGCGSMLSSQVSTSSFYTQSSSSARRVAKSPNLKLGQAKTAVGALLAMSDTQEVVSNEQGIRQHNEGSILPPRFWVADDRDHHHSMEDDIDFAVDRRYESFHETTSRYSQGSMRDSHIATSFDNESTVHGSPSSNILRSSRAGHRASNNEMDGMRFSMKDALIRGANLEFDPIVDENMMARSSESELNISGISHSTTGVEILQSLVDDDFDDDAEDEEAGAAEESSYFRKIKNESRDFRETFRRNRIHNQRRMQEDLLQSILERLQDTPALVLEIMESVKAHPASLQNDSLFTGFPVQQRGTICHSLNKITTTRENLFMSSDRPSAFAATDDDLLQAVSFCRSLVRTAIPSSEKPVKLQL